jgi:Beta-propeller repeat
MLGGFSGSILRGASDPRYGQIPVVFIANRGQVHHSVRFTAKSPGFTAYFTAEEVVIDVLSATVRMRYLGANVSPDLGGLDLQEGKANYLIGNDPSKWQTDVPLFGRVVYRDLYPGIDMFYSSSARQLKSEFVVAPGADPSRIQIAYTGVAGIRIDEAGGLIFRTPDGELREAAPVIYQEAEGRRDPVKGAFRVSGDVVSFFVEEYDRSRELRIDPVLSYSTYLGGNGTNRGNAIAVDASNSAYITGYTDSTNFPGTLGGVQNTSGGSADVFVTKLNASGSAILYSTYLGGSGDDRGFSIAVDGSGNAYVTGWTSSPNFPTVAAFQPSFGGGGRDAFVAKLNPFGNALVFSTFLGGSGFDSGNGIAIDGSGVYVTGSTSSANFLVAAAFQATLGGGQDGFVTKLNAAGNGVIYSTYLGGSLDDRGSSIAVDSSGFAYVAGNTSSFNFPIASALQSSNGGATDAFVTKLSATGSALIYSTYLGGSGVENVELGRSIAVDSANNAYITGMTASVNFPTFQPLQASLGGSNDAFVVKLNAAGTAFVYSTYVGGSSIDYGESIAVDGSGNAYVAGFTSSPDFPSVNADQPAIGGSYDAFIAKLNASGSALTDTDFLGGSGADSGYGIALDTSGSAYMTGSTSSTNFPLKSPAQGSLGTGTLAAFVARFIFGATGPPTAVSVTPPGSSGASQTFTLVYSDTLGYADISWVEMNWNATQSTAGACYLHYDRIGNAIQLASDSGNGGVGSVTPGVVGILQNSQCILDGGASSVSGSGNNLTLNLALTFKQAFTGAKNIYMQVQNVSGVLAPWQARGTWIVTAAGPMNVSVAPASGSGASQAFSFVYSDPYGYADIHYVEILFQSSLSMQNACYVQYSRVNNSIDLVADSGSGYAGSLQAGIAGTVSNSQCTVDAGASSASHSGNNLTVTLALTFKPSFAGAKNIYMDVVNNANALSGWQVEGAWTVVTALPANVSVAPVSGSGASQTFSFVYSDPAGYADIHYVEVLFQSSLSTQNACYVQYSRVNNSIDLVADSGTAYAGSTRPGIVSTVSNSQCSVDAGASSTSGSGNNLTVTLALTFKPVFSGAKNVYLDVVNNANALSGWQAKGAWTVAAAPPANISVAPASGSGGSQTFSFVYSDPYGYTDIHYVEVLFQSSLSTQNACYVQYSRVNNSIDLVADSGSGYAGSLQAGIAGTVSNSQCTVDAGASSVLRSGNNLTVTLALSFKPAFAGAKNVYLDVVNNANGLSGWQVEGAWTVP